MAMLEVFHLLHCSSPLRRAMDKEYCAAQREKAGENAMRAHDDRFVGDCRDGIMLIRSRTLYRNATWSNHV